MARPGKGRNRGKSREPVVHFVEWTTSWVGKHGKRAGNGGKAASQWSTLKSEPLARSETGQKAENRGKAVSQWSTLPSGPLAGAGSLEKGKKPRLLAIKKAF